MLVEADDSTVLDRIAGRLAMDCVSGVGKSHSSAILSRWQIRESVNHALLRPSVSGSFLEATIVDASGREWIVAALHLPPGATEADESRRKTEMAEVLDVFARRRSDAGHTSLPAISTPTPRSKKLTLRAASRARGRSGTRTAESSRDG